MNPISKYLRNLKDENQKLQRSAQRRKELREQQKLEKHTTLLKTRKLPVSMESINPEPRPGSTNLTSKRKLSPVFGCLIIAVALSGTALVFNNMVQSEYGPSKPSIPFLNSSSTQSVTPPEIANDEIAGEMFVVTRGGTNYRLGDVKIEFTSIEDVPFSTRTDSSGKFSIRLPPGFYSLRAEAHRDVGDEIEKYYWGFTFSTSTGQTKIINLSNSNMAN